jgi:hypothetical protein
MPEERRSVQMDLRKGYGCVQKKGIPLPTPYAPGIGGARKGKE